MEKKGKEIKGKKKETREVFSFHLLPNRKERKARFIVKTGSISGSTGRYDLIVKTLLSRIRDCPFGDAPLLANVAKLATMRSLWMSLCAVSIGACKILSQKMPMLNVQVIDENGILDTMLDRCLVDKLYVYPTVAGPRS
ncbi:hypothetical protein R6Q57_017416 [Mikania cordata]